MAADGQRPGARSPLAELKSHISTGNAVPVLHEIRAALARLLDTGEPTIIDLGAFPFAAGDERRFDAVLGRGEVRATLETVGHSVVEETGIPGVWRVDHFDTAGAAQSRFVEITFLPEILKTHREDAESGLARLSARLIEAEPPQH